MPINALRSTLVTLMASGADDNPALNALLSGYVWFHLVEAIVGGLFLVALALFAGFCWRRFRRSSGTGGSFERRTYLWFGLLGTTVSLFLAVVVVANVSSVLNPRPGFSGSFGLIGSPPTGSPAAELQESFTGWLRSGSSQMPAPVTRAIADRVAWQGPKAVICAVLLAALVRLSVVVWRTLIRRSGGGVLLLAGVAAVPACLLLMLMVMGNVQGSLVPITSTMLFG
jgi:hypothetical protein